MAVEIIKLVFGLPPQKGMTQVTKLVFLKLADHANLNGLCWPSHGLIANQCWLSKSAIKSHIKTLQKAGLLSIQHRKNGSINQSNYYRINLNLLQQLASSEKNPQEHQATEDEAIEDLPIGHDMTDSGASEDPRTINESSVKPSTESSCYKRDKKEATTTKKMTVFIDDWQASDSLITACLAMPNSININIDEELEKFRDYYLSKWEARADWNASFRNWCRNAIDRQKNRPAANSRNLNQPMSLSDKARRANEAFLSSNPETTSSNADIIEHIA
jgi:hypothetical protein